MIKMLGRFLLVCYRLALTPILATPFLYLLVLVSVFVTIKCIFAYVLTGKDMLFPLVDGIENFIEGYYGIVNKILFIKDY
jgi:hypothetical protein